MEGEWEKLKGVGWWVRGGLFYSKKIFPVTHYLCRENNVQGLFRFSFFGDNLMGFVSSGSDYK
jgi:hypothetical protein